MDYMVESMLLVEILGLIIYYKYFWLSTNNDPQSLLCPHKR